MHTIRVLGCSNVLELEQAEDAIRATARTHKLKVANLRFSRKMDDKVDREYKVINDPIAGRHLTVIPF